MPKSCSRKRGCPPCNTACLSGSNSDSDADPDWGGLPGDLLRSVANHLTLADRLALRETCQHFSASVPLHGLGFSFGGSRDSHSNTAALSFHPEAHKLKFFQSRKGRFNHSLLVYPSAWQRQ